MMRAGRAGCYVSQFKAADTIRAVYSSVPRVRQSHGSARKGRSQILRVPSLSALQRDDAASHAA